MFHYGTITPFFAVVFLSPQKSCLPFESVARIMKSQIPKEARTKITQKSKELVQESVSEFIRFITCTANAKLLEEQAEARREFAIKKSEERKQAAMNNREPKKLTLKERKKLNADDILHAMTTLGFDDYNETLREYLGEYRERNRESKLPAKRKRQKVQKQPER